MEIGENLLLINQDGKLIMKTFSLENGKSNNWGVTKLGALLTKLSEEGETGDVLKKTNDFTLSFGKFVLVFHSTKECQEFFENYVDKLTTDVIDEDGNRITREEDFKRSSFIINEQVDEEGNPIDESSDQEITDENRNEFSTKEGFEQKRKEFLEKNPEFKGMTSVTFVLKNN